MAIAGSIVATLIANTDGWTTNLSKALTPLSAMATAVAGFTVVGITRFTQVGSALDDMSQRTGIAATELSRLEYAAKMSDTSLESLQQSVVKMQQFFDAAQSGGAEATAVLHRLNLSMASLEGLTPDQRLYAIADAIARLDTVAERTTIGMKIFGKGFVDILPLLSMGKAGITELLKTADELGLVMSQEDVEAAAKFGDTMDTLLKVLDVAAIRIGGELVPILQRMGELLIYVSSKQAEWIREMILTAAVIATVVKVLGTLISMYKAWRDVQASTQALSGPKGWATLAVGILIAYGAVKLLKSEMFDFNGEMQHAVERAEKARIEAEKLGDANLQLGEKLKSPKLMLGDILDQYRGYLPLARQITLENESIRSSIEAAIAAGADAQIALGVMESLQSLVRLERSGWKSEWESVADEIRILRGEITETELALQKMLEAGVPEANVAQLRAMYAERERLRQQESQATDEARAAQQRSTQIADRVQRFMTTPADEFAQQMADLRDAVLAGLVDPQDAIAFATSERDRLAKSLIPPEADVASQRQAINEAISINSEGANRQLTSLLNRRPGQSWEAKMTDEQKKAREQLEEINAQLLNTNGYLSQWRPVESRPLRGRN